METHSIAFMTLLVVISDKFAIESPPIRPDTPSYNPGPLRKCALLDNNAFYDAVFRYLVRQSGVCTFMR